MWRSASRILAVPYLFTAALLPLLLVPLAWTPFYLQKGIITACIFGIFACVAAFSLVRYRSSIELPRSLLAYAGVPLFLIACLSLFTNGPHPGSFSGLGFEVGTLGSLFLFSVAGIAGACIPRNSVRIFFYALIASTAIASVLSVVLTMARPDATGAATFAGSWPDLTYIIAAALLVSVIFADTALRLRPRLIYAGTSILLLLTFLSFFEITAAVMLLVMLAGAGSLVAVAARAYTEVRIPFAILVSSACVLIFIVIGIRSPVMKVAPADGHPSFISTALIAGAVYTENLPRALLGTGPASFAAAWERYRLLETNASPFADVAPDYAYSTAATFAVTLGLMGLLSFSLIPLLLAVSVVSHIAKDSSMLQSAGKEFPAALTLALFSYSAMFVYPIALPLLLIAGAATGIVAGLSVREQSDYRLRTLSVTIPVAVLLAGCGLFLLQTSLRQFFAAELNARGNAISTENSESRTISLMFAARAWDSSVYDIDASRALFQQANARARQSTVDVQAVKTSLSEAVRFANLATQVAQHDYRAWLYLASLYVAILSTGYPDAEQNAHIAISQAGQLAPMRPEVPFLEAQVALQRGDAAKAGALLRKALVLNPDYADARNLLNSISAPESASDGV